MIGAAAVNLSVYIAAVVYVYVVLGWTVKAANVTVWVMAAICAVFLVLDMHLVVLHIYLKCRNISTLDLIIER